MSVDAPALVRDAATRLRADLERIAIDAELLHARINGTRRVLDDVGGPTIFDRDYQGWERALQHLDDAFHTVAGMAGVAADAQFKRFSDVWDGLRDLNGKLSDASSREETFTSWRLALERLMAAAANVICEQLLLLAELVASPVADGARAVRTQVIKAYEILSAPGRDAEMASRAWTAPESRQRAGQAQEPRVSREQLTATEREVDVLAWLIATRHRRYNGISPSDRQKAEKAVAQRIARKRPPPPPPRAAPRPPPPVRR